MNNSRVGKIKALLTFCFAVVVCLGATAVTNAQYRTYPDNRDGQYRRDRDWGRRDRDRDRRDDRYGRNNGYGNNGYGNNNYRIAQSQGYQNGINTGASDAQRGQSFNPQRSHYYRDANSQAFRQGFLQGYDEGYRQYSGYGNRGYGRGNNSRRNNGDIGGILGGIFGRP